MNLNLIEKLVEVDEIRSSKKDMYLIKLEKEVVIGYLPKLSTYDKIADLFEFLNSEIEVLTKKGNLVSIPANEILDVEKITGGAEFANFLSYYKKNLTKTEVDKLLFETEFEIGEIEAYLMKEVNLVKLLEKANKQIGISYLFFQISFNFISDLRKAYEKIFRTDFVDDLFMFAKKLRTNEVPFYWIYENCDKKGDVLNKKLAAYLKENKDELIREDEIVKALLEVVDEDEPDEVVDELVADEQFNPQMETPDEIAKLGFDEVPKTKTKVERQSSNLVYRNWAD